MGSGGEKKGDGQQLRDQRTNQGSAETGEKNVKKKRMRKRFAVDSKVPNPENP